MDATRRLLERLVSLHDRDGRPRSAAQLADELDRDPADVRDALDTLQSYELVKRPPDGRGYVPTVTARELLELDIDEDEFVILEIPDDPSSE